MNDIIKINPIFFKKINKRKFSPYVIDFKKLKNNIKNFKIDLINLLSKETQNEIAFELLHQDLVPSKTKRINKNLLNYFKWQNYGSIYDNNEGRIILLMVSNKQELEKNIELIEYLDQILNLSPIVETNLYKKIKLQFKIQKQLFNLMLFFITNLYKKINSYQGVTLKKDTEYIADILCNQQVFNTNKKSDILFNSNDLNEEKKKYLFNTFENYKLNFSYKTFDSEFYKKISIPEKTNKITIGILDGNGQINKNFTKKIYINNKNMNSDFDHGALVSSIAMMGDKLNNFDDGCGVFDVLLCVIAYEEISSNEFIKNIEKAIKENYKQIKIWNISLGGEEIKPFNETSWIGRKLDEFSEKYDVIFVVSGGNDKELSKLKYLTTPSDSLLSISVNSIDKNNEIASYSRRGTFFLNNFSPTCSAFGGDENGKVIAISNNNTEKKVKGTSFAAPFVCRLLAKLLEVFPNLSILEVYSLFYHSLFLNQSNNKNEFFGISKIPLHINDIVSTKDNITRLIFSGITSNKESECAKFDIPLTNGVFDNKIYMTTISKSIINHSYGIEAVRTSITSKLIAKDKKDIKLREAEAMKEIDLIKKEKKWHMISHKKFEKNIKKTFWNLNSEFLEWEINLTNENRDFIDPEELKYTKIPFSIIIDIENKSGYNNFQKILQRLSINNFSPTILIQNDIYIDEDIKMDI